jgi:hypothetical protein
MRKFVPVCRGKDFYCFHNPKQKTKPSRVPCFYQFLYEKFRFGFKPDYNIALVVKRPVITAIIHVDFHFTASFLSKYAAPLGKRSSAVRMFGGAASLPEGG